MHGRCGGFFVDVVSGEMRRCTCSCHPERMELADPRTPGMPFLIEREDPPDLIIEGDAGERYTLDHGTDESRARIPGRCEHCGEPCRRYFAVGHDAKLKSELARDAAAGDVEALAELYVREWVHLVRLPRDLAKDEAIDLARREGWDLVAKRNARRASKHSD